MKRLHPLFFAAAALLLAACGSRNAASLDDFEGFEGQTVEAGVNGIRI